MKKIAILFAMGAMVLAVGSCKQNTEPKFTPAQSMTLNTPPMANQGYILGPDMDVHLTWSQPDWGFAAVGTYQIQISFESEFVKFYNLPTTYTLCNVDVPGKEIAEGINKLRGIGDVNDWTPEAARPLYVRIHAYIEGVAESDVLSNVITLSQVTGYDAILAPGRIYLVGSPEGWSGPEEGNAAHYAAWALYEAEDAIDSKIYSATFDMPADPIFRFYTALTGWDKDSHGAPGGDDDDHPVKFPEAFANGTFESQLIKTKDSFEFPDYAGGSMTITVNLSETPFTVKMVSNPQ